MKRTRKDDQKAALDRKTSYLTLLPAMGEGFHTGYQARAGVVSDRNQQPHEWLESVAKNLLTLGEDVGYSIPDVLAGEAQLRRLMRLPYEDAMRHQELIDWRGALSMLLLWDGWEKDDTWPELSLENMLAGEGGGFMRSVRAALPPARAAFGLWLYTLTVTHDGVPDRRALGLLSPAVALSPAANPGDLTAFIPEAVRWYNRKRQRFEDPCPLLSEADRARLLQRLRYLQALNERAELQSPLYAVDASLCGLLDSFIGDLLRQRGTFRERLEAGEQRAERELYIRALAVYGLKELNALPGLERRDDPLALEQLAQNPLLCRLAPAYAQPPAELGGVSITTYFYKGKAFAIDSPLYLLEPANAPGEDDVLRRLWQEASLPLQFDGDWNRALAMRFLALGNSLTGRLGASRRAIALLREWSTQRGGFREAGDRAISLQLPLADIPATLPDLTRELIGLDDIQTLTAAFSDCLLLCEGDAPYRDPQMNECCAVQGVERLYAVPPIGQALALWLASAAQDEADPFLRPHIPVSGLHFEAVEDQDGRKVRARIQLIRRRRVEGAAFQNRIELSFTYLAGAEFAQGMAVPVPARQLPSVRCWPATRLAPGAWTAYYVLAQHPDAVDVVTPIDGRFAPGEARRAIDTGVDGLPLERRFHITRTPQWPLFVGLTRGKLSLGALINDETPLQLKREMPAAISIDFGSNATTVMLRQGEHIRPASLEPGWLKTLLAARIEDDRLLPDEFLPRFAAMSEQKPSTFVSAMDMYGDDEAKWQNPLLDGHIYYPPDLAALLAKNPSALYYDLKWGEEPHVMRCLRLFLKQAMLQATLAARLAGSPTVSWRVSMPNAMPLHRQEAYLATVGGLAKEVAAETGVPLTQGVPTVLYASENQADGLYFRRRNEVNAMSGFINMDVGGGTTDVSVWLGGAPYAAVEASLLLGCRQLLFDSLSEHRREAFQEDFATASDALRALVGEMALAFSGLETSLRTRQKNIFLMDAFFAGHSDGVREMMAETRAYGRTSLLEGLLLFNFGFLFRICGELLEKCNQVPETRAMLSPKMQVCVAGGGGQFLHSLDDATRGKLFDLALLGLSDNNPVTQLMLVLSSEPKQEVAIGLLADDERLRSTVQGATAPAPAQGAQAPAERRRLLLKDYVRAFYSTFPMAGQMLLGPFIDSKTNTQYPSLTPSAEMALDAILDNELAGSDECAGHVRAFAAMKRLWRI